jgi:hypothetical protein
MKRILMWLVCVFPVMILLSGCSHQPKPSAVESAKGSFDELRMAVGKKIEDPARASEAVGLVDQLEQVMTEAVDARNEHTVRLRELNASYDAAEENFRALFADFNAKQKGRQDRLLSIDQRAREITTDREWKAISKDVARALEASARAELGM